MFMATGMMAQSLISTGMVLAEETTNTQAVVATDTKETEAWDVPLTAIGQPSTEKPSAALTNSVISKEIKMSFDGRSMTFKNGKGSFGQEGYSTLRLYVSNSIPNKKVQIYTSSGDYMGYGKEVPADAEKIDSTAIRDLSDNSAIFTLNETQLQTINSYKYIYLGQDRDNFASSSIPSYLGQQANVSDLYINAPMTPAPVYVHYLSDAGEYLEPIQTLEGKIGESYTTEAKEFEGYTLSKAPENPSGIFSETEQHIVYVYTKAKEVNYIHAEDGEVEYGSEWNNAAALKAANVVAIDANGNDVTDKAIFMNLDNNPVDTKKPGKYRIKFLVRSVDNLVSEDVTITVKEPEIIGDVTVNYVDEEGNKVAESEVLKGEKYGETYETAPKEIAGYQVKEIPENANGTFNGEPQTVTYVYEKAEAAPVTVKYVDKDGKELVATETLNGTIGDSYETQAKEIDGYVLKETPENAKGTFGTDPQTVTYVYEKAEAAPVTVEYVDTDGKELVDAETLNGTIGDSYETQAKEIDGYVLKETPENAKGIFSDKAQTVTYVYEKAEAAPVTVEYVDTDGKELVDAETLNGTIGDSYETQAKEIDGYVLKETPENAKGIFSDKAQTVTYVYEADVDHKLTANKFTIGKDTYVTGTAGADIGYVDLYINGVFAKRAQVNADGSYKVYGTVIQNKADDVKVVALDADKKPIEPEVSSPVELEILGEENEFKLQTNDYTFGDVYVTGTYDNDKADRVKLLIDGKVFKQNIIGASDSDQFSLNVAGYITGIDDHLYEIAEYNGNNIIRRTTINVKEKEEVNYTITANDYTVGEQAITGSWNGDKNSTHVALKVDGQIVKLAEVNSDGTYSLSANGFVTSPDQDVEVVLYNKATKQIFSSITPKITMGVTAEVFTIGEDNNIIGTFDSRETTDVDTIRLLEDGVAVKLVKYSALAEADQSPTTAYTLAAKAVITDKTKTYKIQHLKDGKLHSSTTLSVK